MKMYSESVSLFDEDTGQTVEGCVVDTAYCNVTSTWNILVVSETGVFRSFNPESFGVRAILVEVEEEQEEDGDADEDV